MYQSNGIKQTRIDVFDGSMHDITSKISFFCFISIIYCSSVRGMSLISATSKTKNKQVAIWIFFNIDNISERSTLHMTAFTWLSQAVNPISFLCHSYWLLSRYSDHDIGFRVVAFILNSFKNNNKNKNSRTCLRFR